MLAGLRTCFIFLSFFSIDVGRHIFMMSFRNLYIKKRINEHEKNKLIVMANLEQIALLVLWIKPELGNIFLFLFIDTNHTKNSQKMARIVLLTKPIPYRTLRSRLPLFMFLIDLDPSCIVCICTFFLLSSAISK